MVYLARSRLHSFLFKILDGSGVAMVYAGCLVDDGTRASTQSKGRLSEQANEGFATAKRLILPRVAGDGMSFEPSNDV